MTTTTNGTPTKTAAPRTETRELMCKLTRDEMLERGKTMAERDRKMADFETEADAFKLKAKSLLAEAERLGIERTKLAIAIDAGEEARKVKCTWREAVGALAMELVRDDTHEVVETRDMTADERQRRLKLDEFPAVVTEPSKAEAVTPAEPQSPPPAAPSKSPGTKRNGKRQSTRRTYAQ